MFEAFSHNGILILGSQEFVHKSASVLSELHNEDRNQVYSIRPHCNISVTIRAAGRVIDKPHVLFHRTEELILSVNETRQRARAASIKVWQRILKLLPVDYFAELFHIIHARSTEISEHRPVTGIVCKPDEVSWLPKPVAASRKLVNLWIQSALKRSELSSDRERHHLLMPVMLTLIENDPVPNGEERGKYGETTGNESLKIVDEVAPGVATALSFNDTRLPKENDEHCGSSNRRPKKNGNRLFESNIHRLPLTHLTGHHTSHFLHQLQSQPVGLAT